MTVSKSMQSSESVPTKSRPISAGRCVEAGRNQWVNARITPKITITTQGAHILRVRLDHAQLGDREEPSGTQREDLAGSAARGPSPGPRSPCRSPRGEPPSETACPRTTWPGDIRALHRCMGADQRRPRRSPARPPGGCRRAPGRRKSGRAADRGPERPLGPDQDHRPAGQSDQRGDAEALDAHRADSPGRLEHVQQDRRQHSRSWPPARRCRASRPGSSRGSGRPRPPRRATSEQREQADNLDPGDQAGDDRAIAVLGHPRFAEDVKPLQRRNPAGRHARHRAVPRETGRRMDSSWWMFLKASRRHVPAIAEPGRRGMK